MSRSGPSSSTSRTRSPAARGDAACRAAPSGAGATGVLPGARDWVSATGSTGEGSHGDDEDATAQRPSRRSWPR